MRTLNIGDVNPQMRKTSGLSVVLFLFMQYLSCVASTTQKYYMPIYINIIYQAFLTCIFLNKSELEMFNVKISSRQSNYINNKQHLPSPYEKMYSLYLLHSLSYFAGFRECGDSMWLVVFIVVVKWYFEQLYCQILCLFVDARATPA